MMVHACDAAAAHLAGYDHPVLLPDACSLLDLVRAPIREHFTPAEGTAAMTLLAQAEAQPPALLVVVNQQVEREFRANIESVVAGTRRELEAAAGRVQAMVECMRSLSKVTGPVEPIGHHLNAFGFPATGQALAERFLTVATVLVDGDGEIARATRRVSLARTPAALGKDSTMDCLNTETYLRFTTECRARGRTSRFVFLTSNKNDYCSKGRSVAKDDLAADLDVCQLGFASCWAAARYALGSIGVTP